MKILKKIGLPVLMVIIFASCKNKNNDTSHIQVLNDSSVNNNNSSTSDSIKAMEENTPTGSYPYYPKKSEANKDQKEESVSENKAAQEQQEQNSSAEPEQEHKKGWNKGAQGAVIGGATGAEDKK